MDGLVPEGIRRPQTVRQPAPKPHQPTARLKPATVHRGLTLGGERGTCPRSQRPAPSILRLGGPAGGQNPIHRAREACVCLADGLTQAPALLLSTPCHCPNIISAGTNATKQRRFGANRQVGRGARTLRHHLRCENGHQVASPGGLCGRMDPLRGRPAANQHSNPVDDAHGRILVRRRGRRGGHPGRPRRAEHIACRPPRLPNYKQRLGVRGAATGPPQGEGPRSKTGGHQK